MKKQRSRVFASACACLLLWVALTASAPAFAQGAVTKSELDAFDTWVADAVSEWEAPGLGVAIIKNDEVVFAKGYGVAELGKPGRFDEHTLSSVGSTTKAIAAAAIGLLVDEGKLDWDDPVVQHMPQFRLHEPSWTEQVRVRDLLTHNVGVPNTDFLWYQQEARLEEVVAALRYVPAESPMYSHFTYQNVMYAAAGQLTEVITGKPWWQVIEERIFAPLGMERSVAILERTELRDNVATPHHTVDGEIVPIENASVDSVAAAGSIWSSVREMIEWSGFLLRGCKTRRGEALLTRETCAELFRPQTLVGDHMKYPAMSLYDHHWFTYGLGWFQTDYQGRALDFHTGSIDGLVAIHGVVRGEKLGVYVLANRDHVELRHAILLRVLDLYGDLPEGGELRDWSAELLELYAQLEQAGQEQSRRALKELRLDPRPPLALASYAGLYTDPLYGTVQVFESAGGLHLKRGLMQCRLASLGADVFECPWETRWRGSVRARFGADASGAMNRLDLGQMQFSRAAAP